jgi:hypothetical protein
VRVRFSRRYPNHPARAILGTNRTLTGFGSVASRD